MVSFRHSYDLLTCCIIQKFNRDQYCNPEMPSHSFFSFKCNLAYDCVGNVELASVFKP